MPTIGGIVVATGAAGENRRSLRDLVDELARPVNVADDTIRALAADSVREAIRIMNRKGCWPWEIMDEDISIVANARFSTVSSTVKKPLSMHFLDAAAGNENRRIEYVEYDKFRATEMLDISGEPHLYTFPNFFETGQIRWHPIPGAAYDVRFSYYRNTPIPYREEETVEVPDSVLSVYMAFARLEFAKRTPAAQAIIPISFAFTEARIAFRELSAHVNVRGDR